MNFTKLTIEKIESKPQTKIFLITYKTGIKFQESQKAFKKRLTFKIYFLQM